MTDTASGLDELAALVVAVYPEHPASAHEPKLEDDAHPAVRALWSRLGQLSSLDPGGITRTIGLIRDQMSHCHIAECPPADLGCGVLSRPEFRMQHRG
jgi:hypothetical protein